MTFLLRLLVFVGALAGIGYGVLWALATFVEPQPREARIAVPPSKLVGKAP
jgi:hypothetical protein